MAAANTDKLRKLSRKWVGQIGSGGVSDAVVTTIPLASTTNLATDTAVTLVIDRVDSAGVKTPNKEETIVGVVSGSNIVNSVRGVEGTAQAHDAGAVVEVLVTADGYNDIIDHLLVGHLQDGRHSGSAITASNIAASAITSGTIAASAVVAGNLAASSVVLGNMSSSSISAGSNMFFIPSQAQGDILYRDSGAWARLPAGTSGHFLKTQGAGANPIWDVASTTYDKCRVRLSGDVSLTASTPTKITFDTEDYDVGGRFASNKFTVVTAGYYRILAQVHFYNGTTTTSNFTVYIYKNGSSVSSANIAGNGVIGNSCAANDTLYLSASDYIECYATAPAANWLAYAETTLTHMNIEQISAG